jgi:Domain of unknown function (DUF4062)
MTAMKVFISSVIGGFEPQREAARSAVTTLRYEPVMAEDFGARPSSPQIACLQGLRDSDLMVLILGESYGAVPPGSSLSATHQEYREARDKKPILAFVQQGISPDREQAAFIGEVQGWEGGLFRGGFTTPEDLQAGIIRALHDFTLASAVAPVDQDELLRRAEARIPRESRNQTGSPFLALALVGGPTQRILRPVEIEDQALADEILQSAMFGEHRVFDRTKGNEMKLVGGDLIISQGGGSSILLNEEGDLLLHVPLDEPEAAGGRNYGGMMVIIEEMVQEGLANALAFAAGLLERIDPTQRLTHTAIAASISGAEYRAWRTRKEHLASPSSVQIGMNRARDRKPVVLLVRRAALRLDRAKLVEDLLVSLRRQFPLG